MIGDEKVSYPHITLNSLKDNFVKSRRLGGAPKERIPVELDKFREMILKLENLNFIEIRDKKYFYFVIILSGEHHTQDSQKMLKALGLEVVSILTSDKLIVKAEKDFIDKWKEKDKIPLYIRKHLREIRPLLNTEKISTSLRKLLSDLKSEDNVDIIINPVDGTSQEKAKMREELEKLIGKDYNYSSFMGTFSCKSNPKLIDKLAELSFVKSLSLKSLGTPSDLGTSSLHDFEDFEISQDSVDYGTLCILDTGVNSSIFPDDLIREDFNKFSDGHDYFGHGTGVASVALFGTDLLNRRKFLKPKCKILNFKIAHHDKNADIAQSLYEAITKYSKEIFVYNLSYNYQKIDEENRVDLAEKLDCLIQEANVILVNSAGNIEDIDVNSYLQTYPSYLLLFPCYCPAEAKSIFSVGSICRSSTYDRIKFSSFTRLSVSPLFMSDLLQSANYIKPDINTYGGNNLITQAGVAESSDLAFPVFDNYGQIIGAVGTSLSAPLISQAFLKLKNIYPNLKNSEVFKAILLNHARIHSCDRQPLFSLIDFDKIGYCSSDEILLNYEGTTSPHQRKEDDKKKETCECFSIEFDMPPEASSLDLIAVHSNNYKFRKLDEQNTRLVVKVEKAESKSMQKDFGNIGKFSSVSYGSYHFKRNYACRWKIKIYLETQGIPEQYVKNLLVRWGVSLKVNLKRGTSKDRFEEIYEGMGGRVKDIVKVPVQESIIQQHPASISRDFLVIRPKNKPIAVPS